MKNVIKLSIFLAVVFAGLFLGFVAFAQYDYYNYGSYPTCTNRAYKDCQGNNVYWYSSCGQQQDFIQNCSIIGLVCKYGQCVQPVVIPPPVPPYIAHYKLQCKTGNVYWYDNLGVANDLYKSCSNANTCMQPGCSAGKCTAVLKCDGSTCAQSSADYQKYCAQNQPNPTPDPAPNTGLTASFFAKKDANSNQWQKTVQVNSNDKVYFMVSVANSSSNSINNLTVSANIPTEISSLGNLQVNGVQTSGDIVEGVNIGTLDAGSAKTITFEGRTQVFSEQGQKQAFALAKIGSATPSTDTVSLDLNPSPADNSNNDSGQDKSGFWEFLKRWYLWILMAVVLVFLFVIVFRRLSSGNE